MSSVEDSASMSFLSTNNAAGRAAGRGRVSRGRGGRGGRGTVVGRGRAAVTAAADAGPASATASLPLVLPEPIGSNDGNNDGDIAMVDRLRALPLSLTFREWFDRLMRELELESGMYFDYAEAIMSDDAEALGDRAGRVVEFLAGTMARPLPAASLVDLAGERWMVHRDRTNSQTQQAKEEAHRLIVAQTQESLAELAQAAEQEHVARAERAERARVNLAFAQQYDIEEVTDEEAEGEGGEEGAAAAGGGSGGGGGAVGVAGGGAGEGGGPVVRGKPIPVGANGEVRNNNRDVLNMNRLAPKLQQQEEREALKAKHAEKVAKDKVSVFSARAACLRVCVCACVYASEALLPLHLFLLILCARPH
jgi:hypothetical protein